MDPISLTASILGIIGAASKVATILHPIVVNTKNAPKLATSVYSEANSIRTVLGGLQEYLQNLASAPRARVALIQIDQLIFTLTDAVLTFSRLETLLEPLEAHIGDHFTLKSRLQWAWDERQISKVVTKLQRHKASLSLMLEIIQCESDLRAAEAQEMLERQITALLESNQALAKRLKGLEDAFDARSVLTKRISTLAPRPGESSRPQTTRLSLLTPPSGGSSYSFEQDLIQSPVYKRANRESCGVSFRSSAVGSNAWSIFSGLSLADVSVIAVIGLPVYSADLRNSPHFRFGNQERPISTPPVRASVAAQSENFIFSEPEMMSSDSSTWTPLSPPVVRAPAKLSPSLFHICIEMGQRLREVPGFEQHLLDELRDADETTDPVTIVWRTLRRGEPLVLLFNALAPDEKTLELDSWRLEPKQRPKHATFKFLQACVTELNIPPSECFMVTDLYSDDTTGFMKVIRLMQRMVYLLEQAGVITSRSGLLEPQENSADKTPQGRATETIVKEERIWVRILEQIQEFRQQLEDSGDMTKDVTYSTFGPLDRLVDVHRRFLIDMELLYASPEEDQNMGQLFVRWMDRLEPVYRLYTTDQQRFYDAALMQFSKLNQVKTSNLMAVSSSQVTLFLIEPTQRLNRYYESLLELQEAAELDEEMQKDLSDGVESVRLLQEITKNIKATNQLKARMSDWKGVSLSGLGKLLLFGSFLVSTRFGQRTCQVFLFETAIITCKRAAGQSKWKKEKTDVEHSRLALSNCTQIGDISLISTGLIDGFHECRIHRHKSQDDYIVIHFPSEEMHNKWNETLTARRRAYSVRTP